MFSSIVGNILRVLYLTFIILVVIGVLCKYLETFLFSVLIGLIILLMIIFAIELAGSFVRKRREENKSASDYERLYNGKMNGKN